MTGGVLLQPGPRFWSCPNCDAADVTPWDTTNRFHACRGLRGLTAPLVPAGLRCEVRAVEREDYVGSEDIQYDGDGRPVMAVLTIRDDGQDCAVLAPTAHASGVRGD
jgi:hypothetical protein